MFKIKVYDIHAREIEEIKVNFFKDKKELNFDLLNQYLRVYLSNQRQGTSKTKTKAEVRGGGKKPWKQKGTGRARAGSIRSPLWVGGGVTHGPTPKNWSLKLNKKMVKKAFYEALFLAMKEDKVAVVDFNDSFKKISTKKAAEFVKGLNKASKLLLVNNNEVLFKSFRNLFETEAKSASNVNVYDILNANTVLIEKKAFSDIEKRIK